MSLSIFIFSTLICLAKSGHDTATITQAVVSRVKDGDIILLHDMSDSSVDAAFAIIDQLHKQGYQFVTASQLAAKKGISLEPGVEYRRFGA